MASQLLNGVLESTGYLLQGVPAEGVLLASGLKGIRRSRSFAPDAAWFSPSSETKIYFKEVSEDSDQKAISEWRREVWNEGFSPCLWIVSPSRIDLYNAYARPRSEADAQDHLLRSFALIEDEIRQLDEYAGRLAMDTGRFWVNSPKVNKKDSVDEQLLADLRHLEGVLKSYGVPVDVAQGMIGRVIFTQYLVDRGILPSARLIDVCGAKSLTEALSDISKINRLFDWLASTFNGDMFPRTAPGPQAVGEKGLEAIGHFLSATTPDGQMSLFPYQFDIIPVELISGIYEQFAHSASVKARPQPADPVTAQTANAQEQKAGKGTARLQGVHYTPPAVASLVLDEVMDGLSGGETVIDLTCGSGVFLVEALRRLVRLRNTSEKSSRTVIREVLHNQIFGVDESEAAIRVAAFSLYLAALELDPDPYPVEALKFEPLRGRNLFKGDARIIEETEEGKPLLGKTFDVIVGNPPWTFKGKAGTKLRKQSASERPLQSRGEGQDFIWRALDFAHERTRFGVILGAPHFFSRKKETILASAAVLKALCPVTVIDFSAIGNLFKTAAMPAVALLARHRDTLDEVTVVRVPWTPGGEKAQAFELSPSDVSRFSLADFDDRPELLKIAGARDTLLLQDMERRFVRFGAVLNSLGTNLRDGLIVGDKSRDASRLKDLPFLESTGLSNFRAIKTAVYDGEPAQWPRERATYVAPLLLIKEFFVKTPRPVTAVLKEDTVFTDAFFGASFPADKLAYARLLSGVLSSKVASWFFISTASEFGIWKRRLLIQDVLTLPVPDLSALESDAGKQLVEFVEGLEAKVAVEETDWDQLDTLVFKLYDFDPIDQVVVKDGYTRGTWQWDGGRKSSVDAASSTVDVKAYASCFLSALSPWFSASGRKMGAEIFDLPHSSPLRVVRFFTEGLGDGIRVLPVQGGLKALLDRIGGRMGVHIFSSLVGKRELRIHGENEVILIKPSAKRHWLPGRGLEDADTVLAESFAGGSA